MPSEHQPAVTDDTGRASFPALADRHGHDPGRWLDRPLLGDADSGETPLRQAFSIIRGIGTKAELRAWRAVERQLDRGPRDAVVDRIEHRLTELDEHGERPPLGPDRDGWTAPAADTSGPSFIADAGGLGGADDAEAQKVGTGRLCDTPMSGSPPDDWTLPDGMEPVASAPTETDDGADADDDGGESTGENTLAAALGGDGL